MSPRGRKRKFNPSIPAHINQDKLPNNCYWDKSYSGHWYTTYKDERGKSRRKRIAGPDAKLSDLHRIIEEQNGIERDTFRWLCEELYFKSDKFKNLKQKTKSDYIINFNKLSHIPTKINKPITDVPLKNWDSFLVQKLIDKITSERGPSAAKHAHSFIRLVFSWGKNRGYCQDNPAKGTELPKERKKQILPTQSAYTKLLNYAKKNGTHGQNTKGSCAHYIWAVMEIEYLCRLRGIEARTLTDKNIKDNGLLVHRRKGSRTNITEFNQRLSDVINFLQISRLEIWKKRKMPTPMKPENRPLVVNTIGEVLRREAYNSSWGRFIRGAIKNGVITPEERFSLHDLKRKGVTDTPGTREEKKEGSGHKSDAMMDVYDKSIPVVKPASD